METSPHTDGQEPLNFTGNSNLNNNRRFERYPLPVVSVAPAVCFLSGVDLLLRLLGVYLLLEVRLFLEVHLFLRLLLGVRPLEVRLLLEFHPFLKVCRLPTIPAVLLRAFHHLADSAA